MAKNKVGAKPHTHKNLNVSINEYGELELTGKNKGNKNFQQTLPVIPPCVLFWDDTIENFVAYKIDGNIPGNYELVDVILDIKDI